LRGLIRFATHRAQELVDITEAVQAVVERSGIADGLVHEAVVCLESMVKPSPAPTTAEKAQQDETFHANDPVLAAELAEFAEMRSWFKGPPIDEAELFLPARQSSQVLWWWGRDRDWRVPPLWQSEFRHVLLKYMRADLLEPTKALAIWQKALVRLAPLERSVDGQIASCSSSFLMWRCNQAHSSGAGRSSTRPIPSTGRVASCQATVSSSPQLNSWACR
jgi:hypothetical protein